MKPELRAYAAQWRQSVEILFRLGNTVGVDVVLKEVPEGTVTEPTFRLDYTAAQTLMDDLWNAGLRPTEGAGSAGALAATERHLADMRRLVFTERPSNFEEPPGR